MKKFLRDYAYYISWVTAVLATLGSLYFQYIMNLPPCVLCWYQRIFMYPLVAILAVGIIKKDSFTPLYVLPLSLIGLGIAVYQNLLYYGIISETFLPCTLTGPSCVDPTTQSVGFITIPMLSLLAFVLISSLMIIKLKKYEQGS